jgi:hypothetical protein
MDQSKPDLQNTETSQQGESGGDTENIWNSSPEQTTQ